MKAVRHVAPRRVEVVEVPDPQAGPGQVVVAMRAAGLCGSDLHTFRREPFQPPFSDIPGHEPCGVVESIGPEVSHLKVGDRVTVYHYESCSHCRYCAGGNWFWCDEKRATGWHLPGSCADKLLIAARNCFVLPDELSFIDGAFIACGAGTAWSSLQKLAPTSEDTAVVWGLGPIGLVGVAMLHTMGAHVVAVGRRAARLQLASAMGAQRVLDAGALSGEELKKRVEELFPGGATLAFETSGAPDAQKTMIETLGKGGRAVCVGIGNETPAFNTVSLTGDQISVRGSYVMNAGEYGGLADFLVRHQLNLEQLVTHRFSLDEAQRAFETADAGDAAKVIFEWPDNP